MAEGHSRLAEYEAELDQICESVMPDTWAGHGRLEIQQRGFTGKKRRFSLKLLARLDEKYPDVSGEKLAQKAIEETESRFD